MVHFRSTLPEAKDIHSGRDLLFDENFAQYVKFSSKSYKMYHTAAGEAGCHQVRYPV